MFSLCSDSSLRRNPKAKVKMSRILTTRKKKSMTIPIAI